MYKINRTLLYGALVLVQKQNYLISWKLYFIDRVENEEINYLSPEDLYGWFISVRSLFKVFPIILNLQYLTSKINNYCMFITTLL